MVYDYNSLLEYLDIALDSKYTETDINELSLETGVNVEYDI